MQTVEPVDMETFFGRKTLSWVVEAAHKRSHTHTHMAQPLNINWNPIGFCRYILQSRQITDWTFTIQEFWLAET